MGEAAVPTEAELGRLRACCYRPDPPEDIADVYLAALRRAGRAEVRPVAATRTAEQPECRRSRRPGAAFVLVLASALTLAMTAHHPLPSDRAAAAGPRSVSALHAPAAAGNLLATLSSRGRRTSGALDAGGGTVVLTGLCAGTGSYSVRIGSEPPVPLACEDGPSLVMLSSARPLHAFTVSITDDEGGARWAFSVAALAAR